MNYPSEKIRLLQEEIFAKQKELAELRLAQEAEEISNYEFKNAKGLNSSLLELFGEDEELLVIHNMGKSCVYCTMWADVISGMHHIIRDRVKLVLTSPDNYKVMSEFANSRNWTLDCYSYEGSNFSVDLGFAKDKNERRWYSPGVSALIRKGNKIYRRSYDFFGPGDSYCAPWHFFALLPEGNAKWEPKYKY